LGGIRHHSILQGSTAARTILSWFCALVRIRQQHHETSGLFVGIAAQMALVDDTYLTALSATTGQALWRAQSGDFGFGSAWHDVVAVANGLIYGGRSEELIALHERDGTEAWRVAFKGYLYVSQPVIHDGVLFVFLAPPSSSSSPPQIVALNAATGAIYWRLDVRDGQQLAVFSDAAS
jgi:outer membrane protein assembly factor BamB